MDNAEFQQKIMNAVIATDRVEVLKLMLKQAESNKSIAIARLMDSPEITTPSFTDEISGIRFDKMVKTSVDLEAFASACPDDFENIRDNATDEFFENFTMNQTQFKKLAKSKGMTPDDFAKSLNLEMKTSVNYCAVVPKNPNETTTTQE